MPEASLKLHPIPFNLQVSVATDPLPQVSSEVHQEAEEERCGCQGISIPGGSFLEGRGLCGFGPFGCRISI